MSGISSWLQRQRKGDLLELAQNLGITGLEGKLKVDLETELEEFLSENASTLSRDPRVAGYYNTRRVGANSPTKRDAPAAQPLRVSKSRATKNVAPPEPEPQESSEEEEEDEEEYEGTSTMAVGADTTIMTTATSPPGTATSTALARTPGRALSLASRIPLPATPADVALAVDRSTTIVRNRVNSMYTSSKIPSHVSATRTTLSTITSVIFSVAAFELYFLRKEILADRYAFTIPAVEMLGMSAMPVEVPDMFLLVTSSFWYPALTWAFTSLIGPCIAGYFFNLSAAASPAGPGAGRQARAGRRVSIGGLPTPTIGGLEKVTGSVEHVVDPVAFSIVKALLSYVVYKQGVTFGGWVQPDAVARINGSVYGGWQGVLAGTAVTGLASLYDAVLRK